MLLLSVGADSALNHGIVVAWTGTVELRASVAAVISLPCYASDTLLVLSFASLEYELLDRQRFVTQAEAKMTVFDYIEGFYNPRRRHSSIGQLSPINFERSHREATPADAA